MSLKPFISGRAWNGAVLSLAAAAAILLTSCTRPNGAAAANPVSKPPAKPAYNRPAGAFKVPDFPPGLTWFNVKKPLTLASLHGKMVLLDFWTYG